MSTITTALPFDPADPDARWQFAVAVGEKPTEITGPHDGLYTVTVRGLGEANLTAAIDSFTVDPHSHAPNPPRLPAPTLVPGPDGQMYAVTVDVVEGDNGPVAAPMFTPWEG